ncbi:hypothetical protein TYRP_019023 [Tyrophagus putrescentiae]|nr:hypothetical protein TYRP_019023 [Tyrophagus putrescentiae]
MSSVGPVTTGNQNVVSLSTNASLIEAAKLLFLLEQGDHYDQHQHDYCRCTLTMSTNGRPFPG